MSTFKPHPQLLIDLINAANSAAVPYSAVTLSGPVVNEDVEIAGDTVVTMTAVQDSGYTGAVTASYSRLDFQQLFSIADIQTLAISTNVASTHDMVEAIRDAYGLSLFTADIVDEPISYLEDGTAQVTLTAAAGSYLFSGAIEVAISPVPVELAAVFTVTVLNGLNYPLMDTDHLTTPVTVVGSIVPNIAVPADNFMLINNSEVTLAVSANVAAAVASIAPVEGAYSLIVADAEDWALALSMEVPAGAATHAITDLYAVALYLKSVDTQEVLELALTVDGAGYSFRSADDLVVFALEYSAADGSLAQTLVDLKAAAASFPGQAVNAQGALLGSFEATLEARRINSIAPIVRLVVPVLVELEAPV